MDPELFNNKSFYKFLEDNSVESAWMELFEKNVLDLHITSTKHFYNNSGIGIFIMLLEHNLDKYFKEHKIKNMCRCYYLENNLDLLTIKNKVILFFMKPLS